MNSIIRNLLAKGPVLTDGASGTVLQQKGLAVGSCPDLWNLSHPEVVQATAAEYVEAGSQIILTNTFGSNSIRLSQQGIQTNVIALNQAGAELAKKGAGEKAQVFGSMGPCGKSLGKGEVKPSELLSCFTEQSEALAQSGADGLVIETMMEFGEIEQAIRAAKSTGLPVVACMYFDRVDGDLNRARIGEDPRKAGKRLLEMGADVVGANCGDGIEDFLPVCQQLHESSQGPVWIKANAGIPVSKNGVLSYPMSAEDFSRWMPALVSRGAAFIGGCCGTDPSYVKAMHNTLYPSKPVV